MSERREKKADAWKLDRNMALEPNRGSSLQWHSSLEEPFSIVGFPWFERERKFRRLPTSPADPLPPAVDALADCTAGGQIRFRTNTSRLSIRVNLAGAGNMDHMPATGQCGFDCYLGTLGEQHYISTARFDHMKDEYEALFYDWKTKRDFCVTLNFPLYQGVKELWIGVDEDAEIRAAPAFTCEKPVVIYGTSITQGGCAARPGMAYPNILSRFISLPFVNLGFSGNGKGEPAVARTIAGIDDPALFVLDYEANVGTDQVRETLPVFIRILRERHPFVPILVISKIRFAGERFYDMRLQQCQESKRVQLETINRLRADGDLNLHFIDGSTLLGDLDADECTVDGVHPTDLGFLRMARSLEPVIRELVKDLL